MTGVEYVRDLCKRKGIAISKLEKDLGFSNGYLNPKKMEFIPYDRAIHIYKYLGGDLSLMTGSETEIGESAPYYLNDDAREMAQFMFENPEYKVLFDASRKVSKDDINVVKTLLDKFRSED